jgi:hypothetical protein
MGSRPLAALASLGFTGLGLVLLFPDDASACSRAGGVTAKQVVEDAKSNPDSVVFSGEVIDVESVPGAMFAYTLRVYEVWKGPEEETLKVYTRDPALCGYPFKEGQVYLVFAYEGRRTLKVDGGGGTKPLSKAGADFALLGEGEKVTSHADALNDTSGGLSVSAMVETACLAMASSFLVVAWLVRSG